MANLNIQGTLEAWQKFTVKDWQKSIQKMRIGVTNDLYNSFINSLVQQSGGDVEKLIFIYKYYGKFPDMGVGRGVKVGDIAENRTVRGLTGQKIGRGRRAKKWYNKPFYSNLNRLSVILAEKYGTHIANTIVNEIEFKAV
jgi:hypothetical protein